MSPAPKACPEQQQACILAAAAEAIEESSLIDFTMSAIAKKAAVSMGSIYKQFHSKEDVLLALACQSTKHQTQLFSDLMSQSALTPAERMMAISLLDFNRVDRFSFSRHLEMAISSEPLRRRASLHWRAQFESHGTVCDTQFINFFRQQLEAGELEVEGETDAEQTNYLQQLTLGVWAINVGYIQVLLQTEASPESDDGTHHLPFPLSADSPHVQNCRRMINSFSWKQPLKRKSIKRIIKHLEQLGYR